MCNDKGYNIITTFHNILLAQDLCNRLFSIIRLLNSGHTLFILQKVLHSVLWKQGENVVSLLQSALRKHECLGEISKCQNQRK